MCTLGAMYFSRRSCAVRTSITSSPWLPMRSDATPPLPASGPKPLGRLLLASGISDEDDRLVAAEHRAGPDRVLAVETDVDAAGKVGGGKIHRVSRVEQLGALCLAFEYVCEGQTVHLSRERGV